MRVPASGGARPQTKYDSTRGHAGRFTLGVNLSECQEFVGLNGTRESRVLEQLIALFDIQVKRLFFFFFGKYLTSLNKPVTEFWHVISLCF